MMAYLHALGRYDRMTNDFFELTGHKPMRMYDFVMLYVAASTPNATR
ncbi:hypothetical protein [Burkholderia sp. Bp8963]|nr:hypothetical protein [Burkholderia sp. Bp8963]